MKRLLPVLLLLAAACAAEEGVTPELSAPALTPPPGPAKAKWVVVISIDGLRPDAIEEAPAPALLDMMKRGAHCPTAETIRPSITLPSHTSMLSGLDYKRHGVSWNNFRAGHFGHPTVFTVTAQAGKQAAMFFSKDKFAYLAHPQAVSWWWGQPAPPKIPPEEDYNDLAWVERRQKFYQENERRAEAGQPPLPDPDAPKVSPVRLPEHKTSAENLARAFAAEWPAHDWAMTFVHFRECDEAGHRKGWMGLDYLNGVRRVDKAMASLFETIRDSGRAKDTAVILSADHGGFGRDHYKLFEPNKKENVTIPWICVGPGVTPGLKIGRIVRTYDTMPTALAFLGLGAPVGIDGKPVLEVLAK